MLSRRLLAEEGQRNTMGFCVSRVGPGVEAARLRTRAVEVTIEVPESAPVVPSASKRRAPASDGKGKRARGDGDAEEDGARRELSADEQARLFPLLLARLKQEVDSLNERQRGSKAEVNYYAVCDQATLRLIARHAPATLAEMEAIEGVGGRAAKFVAMFQGTIDAFLGRAPAAQPEASLSLTLPGLEDVVTRPVVVPNAPPPRRLSLAPASEAPPPVAKAAPPPEPIEIQDEEFVYLFDELDG
jgi:hypothetical protein